jgi:hypothetical protein
MNMALRKVKSYLSPFSLGNAAWPVPQRMAVGPANVRFLYKTFRDLACWLLSYGETQAVSSIVLLCCELKCSYDKM